MNYFEIIQTRVPVLLLAVAAAGGFAPDGALAEETTIPQTATELWADFDEFDQANPLDAQCLRSWEDDGVVFHLVRFNVGVINGEMIKIAGFYAYPKGGTNLPALVQINGGGQKASTYGPRKWARYGYACFNPNNGAQEWDGDLKGLPNTDWGSLKPGIPGDRREAKGLLAPGPGTIDDVVSPRNHQWYPRMLAARRAITFLQSRPEIDGSRIGVRGHSTGGVMTVYTSVDPRVKAAVPSVGGCGFWWDDYPFVEGNQRGDGGADTKQKRLYRDAISCDAHWRMMRCPIFFLGATNDFNSPTDNVWRALSATPEEAQTGWTLAPHCNHSFTEDAAACEIMWLEDHLKGRFEFPATPHAALELQTDTGVPRLTVTPDPTSQHKIESVQIYYSYGRNPQTRFWASAETKQVGRSWEGDCPIFDLKEPLFAFANVTCRIDYTVHGTAETKIPSISFSSQYRTATPEELQAAGVKATQQRQPTIDNFSHSLRDWIGDFDRQRGWTIETRKVVDPRFAGPDGATLACEIDAPFSDAWLGAKVVHRRRSHNTGAAPFYAFVKLPKRGWNEVRLNPHDFQNIYGEKLDAWKNIESLTLGAAQPLIRDKRRFFPRAGEKAVPALPTEVSSWNSDYYHSSDDAYAKDHVRPSPAGPDIPVKNLRWTTIRSLQ